MAGNSLNSAVEPGDITSQGSKLSHASSAQEQYYALQTAVLKSTLAKENPQLKYLAVQSPVDELTTRIAQKLVAVQEGSPEWAQLLDIVGDRRADRLQIAKFLAQIQYQKASTESLLARYGASKSEADEYVNSVWDNAAEATRKPGRAALGSKLEYTKVSDAAGGGGSSART